MVGSEEEKGDHQSKYGFMILNRSVVVVVVTGGGEVVVVDTGGGEEVVVDTVGGEEIGGWDTVCWGTGGTGGAIVEE